MPIDTRHPREIRADIRSGKLTGVTAGLGQDYVQANLAVLPREHAYDFLLFCQRNPRPCPLHRGDGRGLAGAGGRGAGRRSPHRHPALPDLQGRRAGRRGDRRHAVLARRSRRLPARLLVHVRVGAAARPASGSGTSSTARTWRCGARRSSAGRPASSTGPWSCRCGPIPAAPARQGGDGERALPRRPRRAGARRRSGRHRHRGHRASPTGAMRSTSSRATCRCSGRAA